MVGSTRSVKQVRNEAVASVSEDGGRKGERERTSTYVHIEDGLEVRVLPGPDGDGVLAGLLLMKRVDGKSCSGGRKGRDNVERGLHGVERLGSFGKGRE
jgi:hypothetical protein